MIGPVARPRLDLCNKALLDEDRPRCALVGRKACQDRRQASTSDFLGCGTASFLAISAAADVDAWPFHPPFGRGKEMVIDTIPIVPASPVGVRGTV